MKIDGRGSYTVAHPNFVYQFDLTAKAFDPLNDDTLPEWVKDKFGKNGFLIRPLTDGQDIQVVSYGAWRFHKDYSPGYTTIDTTEGRLVTIPNCLNAKWEETKCIYVAQSATTQILVGTV